jgi:protein-S-isoprenylcysteine O-methyltransferase Ste14
MGIVILGLLGFATGMGFDAASRPPAHPARWVLGLVSGTLLVSSHLLASLASERMALPGWSLGLGAALLPLGGALLVYSLFLELPFRGTYLSTGSSAQLVRTGTYALSRHPGVLWYGLLMAALTLVTRSQLLLTAAPLWLAADVLWVLLQERILLTRGFPDSADY